MLRVRGAFGKYLSSAKSLCYQAPLRRFYARNRRELPVEEHEERCGLPVIAILGRPNVGKSTLFNCFVRLFSGKYKNSSIVTKIPGTTRDRIHAFLEIPEKNKIAVSRCMLIDTGGISSTSTNYTKQESRDSEAKIDELIRQQAFIAMEQANAIIYITDVTHGINQVDKRLCSWLRRKYKGIVDDRIVFVVNKVDNDERADQVDQFIRLGLGEPVACSAAHSSGLSEVFYKVMLKMIKFKDTSIAMAIEQAKVAKLQQNNENNDPGSATTIENPTEAEDSEENEEIEQEEDFPVPWEALVGKVNQRPNAIANIARSATQGTDLSFYQDIVQNRAQEREERNEIEELEAQEGMPTSKTLKLAILGRPNVGKSSILNAVIGKNRAIVSNIAGTTHDPIDEKIRWRDETDLLLVDTAGIRRRGHHKVGIESLTILWAMQIIERSEVVLLVVDAKEGILRQDKRLAAEILDRNRSIVVVVNKWDGKVKRKNKLSSYEKYVRKELNFLSFVPVVFSSAMNKDNLEPIVDLAILVGQQRRQRIPTRKLMEIVKSMDHKGPGGKKRHFKIKFVTQARVQSPTFALFASNVQLCTDSYKRYVENCIRAKFPFTGTPIRLIVTDPPRKTSVRPNSQKFKKPIRKKSPVPPIPK